VPITWEDKKAGYVVRSRWENDAPLTMSEQCFDARTVSPEFFEYGLMNWVDWNPIATDGATLTLKATEEGERKIVHERVKTPWGFSNRSLILCYNMVGSVTGERKRFEMITSSAGNEEYVKKYAKDIGKDVMADCAIDYWRVEAFTDNESGQEKVRVFNLNHFSINGSIPSFVVSAIATLCGKPVERLAVAMQKHEKDFKEYQAKKQLEGK
jgi:hypothetical protein